MECGGSSYRLPTVRDCVYAQSAEQKRRQLLLPHSKGAVREFG